MCNPASPNDPNVLSLGSHPVAALVATQPDDQASTVRYTARANAPQDISATRRRDLQAGLDQLPTLCSDHFETTCS